MVNITHKSSTLRIAVASALVSVSQQETITSVLQRTVPKGDVFECSRVAGLLACKKTYEAIPDCHPLPVEYASITHEVQGLDIRIRVEVHTVYKTGVEVEAMHGAAITALTIYDMLKPLDPDVRIASIQLEEKRGGKSDVRAINTTDLKCALVVCSDTLSSGSGADESGNLIASRLQSFGLALQHRSIIPDTFAIIQDTAKQLVDEHYDLIIFCGGTGLSPRDVTPDAIRPLIDREIPGIMEAARQYGQMRMPYAMLSRGVAGFARTSLLITLPGSPRGVTETMDAIFPQVLHVFQIRGGQRHG